MTRTEPEIRRATDDDLPEILDVATAALGWNPADPNEEFFRWKHFDNPHGQSPIWVATNGGEIVGFRSMLCWTFTGQAGDCRAVRAVDTATHPNHHRRGIFRMLTMCAVEDLTQIGVDFVFNTPNDKSRAGYLRMGWSDQGRLPTRIAVSSPRSVARLLGARTAAAKWSLPCDAGDDLDATLDDLVELSQTMAPATGVRTMRSADHFSWRYGFDPLHYRVLRADEGAAIVRVRQRGSATEAVLAELLADDQRTARSLVKAARKLPGVDYVLAVGHAAHQSARMAPMPRLGPHLTVRDLASPAPVYDQFRFSLGDIELF